MYTKLATRLADADHIRMLEGWIVIACGVRLLLNHIRVYIPAKFQMKSYKPQPYGPES